MQANQSIGCTVSQCKYHCKDQNYCSLKQVSIGTHEANPTQIECVDCRSYRTE